MADPKETIEFEVCLTCHTSHHEGGNIHELVDPAPWTLWNDETSGKYDIVSDSVCEDCCEMAVDCNHRSDPFSKIPCGGCGTELAGERFNYLAWAKD